MGYRHSRGEILDAAVELVAREGLGALTFRSVGQQLRIADRTVVYYFATKSDLTLAVLSVLADQLEAWAGAALGDRRLNPDDLLAQAWRTARTAQVRAAFRVYFEVVGRAAAGDDLCLGVGPALAERWVTWLGAHLDAPPRRREQLAAAVLARLDGLMLLDLMGGLTVAGTAAAGLGLPPDSRASDPQGQRV